MKSNIINYKIIIIFAILLSSITIYGQRNTLYFMNGIPQAMQLNPANQPKCNVYVELPGLSDRINFNMTSFNFSNILTEGTGLQKDSLVLDINNFYSKLRKRNYINADVAVNIIGFGFRVKDSYFSFNISNHTSSYVGFPKSILGIAIEGNYDWDNSTTREIDLSGLGVNLTNYTEIAFGYSKSINSQLTVGGRFKILKGSANFRTKKSDLILNTDNETLAMSYVADFEIDASFPMEVTHTEEGDIDEVVIEEDLDIMKDFIFNGNNGLGIDLGATYQLDNEITLYASLIDFGYIKWKNNSRIFTSDGNYTFEGVDFSDEFNTDNDSDAFSQLRDSITSSLTFSDSEGDYASFLIGKINIGGTYQLTEKVNVGGLIRTEIYDRRLHPKLAFSLNTAPARWFNFSLSYSVMNNSFANLGTGFFIKPGPFQIYLVNDNLLSLFIPQKVRGVNIQFGMNLIFGCKKKVDYSLLED